MNMWFLCWFLRRRYVKINFSWVSLRPYAPRRSHDIDTKTYYFTRNVASCTLAEADWNTLKRNCLWDKRISYSWLKQFPLYHHHHQQNSIDALPWYGEQQKQHAHDDIIQQLRWYEISFWHRIKGETDSKSSCRKNRVKMAYLRTGEWTAN